MTVPSTTAPIKAPNATRIVTIVQSSSYVRRKPMDR
jgi:hypothetical protein